MQLEPLAGKRIIKFWGELWEDLDQRFPQAGEGRDRPAECWEDLNIHPKLDFLREPHRYKAAWSGRDAAKSWSFARALLWLAKQERLRICCGREFQNSIQESVHYLLKKQIGLLGWNNFFGVQQQTITGQNGSYFFFKGIRNNPEQVLKSLEDVDIFWLEEGQTASEASWQILIPTIRKKGSEIWVSFNRNLATDPTDKRFIGQPLPGAKVQRLSWRDNRFMSEEATKYKNYLASVDLETYNHVFEGECRINAAAAILKDKCVVEYFEPQPWWDGPYFGADWGFAQDPTTLVKCWIEAAAGVRKLYVEGEVYRIGLELDHTKAAFEEIDGAGRYTIRADNARPETISYLRRQGLNIVGAPKGIGSVEDGIAFLRGFQQIVIHPDCTHTADESRLYSYKVDRLTGDVLPVIVDSHNHCIDALRYALEPVIKAGPGARLDWS
jgi:phage terminase large subunit